MNLWITSHIQVFPNRLRQTDYDGTTEIFRPVSVYYEGGQNNIALYPNPVTHDELNISASDLSADSEVLIRVSDINGRVVFSHMLKTNETGFLKNSLDLTGLPKGSYLVELHNDYISGFFKIIKN